MNLSDRIGMNLNATPIPLSEVSVRPVERLSTGVPYLDWCFGHTTDQRGRKIWGLPAGALTLLSGASGSGKSRLAIKVAAAMTQQFHTVLFAQAEVALAQFKGWVLGNNANNDNFLVTQTVAIEELMAMISNLRPTLVVIDSISMFAGRAKHNVMALKRAVEDVHGHGLLLSHENARGQVRGGTTLPHLVDCVGRISRDCICDSWVTFEMGKNRFGPSGRSATFNHQPVGLASVCVSDDRYPMSQIRFDQMTGKEYRRVPQYGTGKTVEIDETGMQFPIQRGFFSRLLGL
jgi:DNA repair protein RadA/Sms